MVSFLFPNKNSLSPLGRELPQAASAKRRASGSNEEKLPKPGAGTGCLEGSTFQELSIRATGPQAGTQALGRPQCRRSPQLRALPGVVKGPKRPQEVQRSSRGEIFHQIPTVWKDSSLRGSGPQCRPKPSEWLPSLGLASLQRSVCVCGMCVHVEHMLSCVCMCLKYVCGTWYVSGTCVPAGLCIH